MTFGFGGNNRFYHLCERLDAMHREFQFALHDHLNEGREDLQQRPLLALSMKGF